MNCNRFSCYSKNTKPTVLRCGFVMSFHSRDCLALILTINAWNEWTVGSCLEPDMENGEGYLNAIKEAVNRKTIQNVYLCENCVSRIANAFLSNCSDQEI